MQSHQAISLFLPQIYIYWDHCKAKSGSCNIILGCCKVRNNVSQIYSSMKAIMGLRSGFSPAFLHIILSLKVNSSLTANWMQAWGMFIHAHSWKLNGMRVSRRLKAASKGEAGGVSFVLWLSKKFFKKKKRKDDSFWERLTSLLLCLKSGLFLQTSHALYSWFCIFW